MNEIFGTHNVAVAAQPTAHLEPVQPQKHHIRHHDIRRRLAGAAERRLTGSGGAHTIAKPAQGQLQAMPNGGIVLD
jgi:hypothetical protein